MAGWTNRGKFRAFKTWFQGLTVPTVFYLALFTSATAPTADTNSKSELTEIAAGNGYTAGGISVARDATDFDVITEDDGNDRVLVQLKDMVWTASAGPIPASGSGARYAGLTDDNATPASRDVLNYFDLVSDRVISDGQTLTLVNVEFRGNES